MDETYIRVKGRWIYLYRAVDKAGQTIDFLLTEKRDRKAALKFLKKAINLHSLPEKITIDKSGANKASVESYNEDNRTDIEHRQIKYLNNIVEQDHRTIKCIVRPMMGWALNHSDPSTLAGIELMHMLKKGQLADDLGSFSNPAAQFYSLAA